MWNETFYQTFWTNFLATTLGVLLSIGLSVGVWFVQKWYTDRNNRKWIKDSLIVELKGNLTRLRDIQKAILQILGNKFVIAQYHGFYLNMSVYTAAVSSGYVKLFTPFLQSKIHDAAAITQHFNILLSNMDAFAVHNVALPSFTKELEINCNIIMKQAEEFEKKIEETVNELSKI